MFSHALDLAMHAENACANHMARDLRVTSKNIFLQESGLHTSKITIEAYKDLDSQMPGQAQALNLFLE